MLMNTEFGCMDRHASIIIFQNFLVRTKLTQADLLAYFTSVGLHGKTRCPNFSEHNLLVQYKNFPTEDDVN